MSNICLWCGKTTITPSLPGRKKKFCNNTCQMAEFRASGKDRLPSWATEKNLKHLYIKQGKSCTEIGEMYGKGFSQIARYLKRRGIKPRPFSTKGLPGSLLGVRMSDETKELIRQKHLGKKLSPKHRAKVIKSLRYGEGENNPNWKGGATTLNKRKMNRLRRSWEMQCWRVEVLERDGNKCVLCGSQKNLHVDHIKPFSLYPKLRTRLSNGRTLCKSCHRQTPTYGGRIKTNSSRP